MASMEVGVIYRLIFARPGIERRVAVLEFDKGEQPARVWQEGATFTVPSAARWISDFDYVQMVSTNETVKED